MNENYYGADLKSRQSNKRRILTQESSENKRKRVYESIDYLKEGNKIVKMSNSNKLKKPLSNNNQSR